jgi:DNA-binding response OmpR family regulator
MTRKLRILVTDDDKIVRKICQTALEGAGFEVDFAEHGQAALDKIVESDFDLLLTDMEMPVMDGMTLLENLTHIPVAPPVIMFTAHSYVPHAVRALTRGAYDFVTKPFMADQLVASVNRCLDAHRLKKEVQTLRVTQSLLPVFETLLATLDSSRVLGLLLEKTCETLKAEGGSVLLHDRDHHTLTVAASQGPFAHEVNGSKVREGERVVGQALETGQVIRLNGPLKNDPRFTALTSFQEAISSMTAPLIVGENPLGVLCIKRVNAGDPFSDEDEQIFRLIAGFGAAALSNALALEALRHTKETLEQQLEHRSMAFEKAFSELQEIKARQVPQA